MVANSVYFRVLMFNILSTFVKVTKKLDWCVGSTFLCIKHLPEDGTLVLQHAGVFIITYECILSSA
jgi:hypothetical protein